MDEWQKAVEEAKNTHAQVVPKDWITTRNFAGRIGKSTPHASRLMRELVRSRKAESKKFVIRVGDRMMPVSHFRLVKKK